MNTYMWFDPTRVVFGWGCLNRLHEYLNAGPSSVKAQKAMVVISNGKSAKQSGALDRTINELEKASIQSVIFAKVEANPLKSTVEEGARFFNDNKCDIIVALGGGSVMDAAKNMAMLAPQDSDDLWTYAWGSTGKKQMITKPAVPYVCITTTAGTGSEVDQAGVITNPETNEKIGVGGFDCMFPALSIVDAELMKTVPAKFTAYQGFDALFHSTEGYISNKSNPMSDMVQRAAIENIGAFLARACKDGNDRQAREAMAFANTMSGYSMVVSGCTSEHSMEHAMSAYHQKLPHGAGLIMISREYYTYFVNRHCCDDRFIAMAQMLGKKDANKPMDFVEALVDLQKACSVDDLKMSDYGIEESEFDDFATNSLQTMGALYLNDPVEMSHEDCVSIYQKSFR